MTDAPREICVNTLGKLLDRGYDITWYCGNEKCGRTLPLTLPQAIELFGRNFRFAEDRLPAKCARCGSTKLNRSLRAPGTGAGVFRTT